MLFGVCKGPSYQYIDALLQDIEDFVDGVEIRIDLFQEVDFKVLSHIRSVWKKKLLFTFRRKDQGGGFTGSLEKQIETWHFLLQIQPDFVDIEYDAPLSLFEHIRTHYPSIQIISSYHNFSSTPHSLESVLAEMKKRPAHDYKIAVHANSPLDTLTLMHFVQTEVKHGRPLTGISMGERGTFSRILSAVYGSKYNYAFWEEHLSTAKGQVSIEELYNVYHYPLLNTQTKVFALLGDPVDASIGSLVHNAVFREHHENAVYVKIRLKKEEIMPFFALAKKLGIFYGFSITTPLKEVVGPLLDSIQPSSQEMGAINTILVTAHGYVGTNTDGIGACEALEKKISLKGKKVVLIGAGGAAKAIAFAIKQKQAEVWIINRTESKAKQIAQDLHCQGGGLSLLHKMGSYDVLINATADEIPISESDIQEGSIVMDIKTVPLWTTFLSYAHKKSCTIIFGYEMFLEQAILQQMLWFPGLYSKQNLDRCMATATAKQLDI